MASPPQYLFIPDPDSPIPSFYSLPLEDPRSPLNSDSHPAVDLSKPNTSIDYHGQLKGFTAPKDRRQVYVLVPPLPYYPKVIEKSPASSLSEAAATMLSILKSTKWREEDMPHIIELKKALFALDAINASLAR